MKLLAIALFALNALPLAAQSGTLSPEQGTAIPFTVQVTTDVSQGKGAMAMTINTVTHTKAELQATNADFSAIGWTYAVSSAQLRISSPFLPKGGIDSAMDVKPVQFTTDRQGRLISLKAADSALAILMGQGAGGGFSMDQFFAPTMSRPLRTDDAWETSTVDTVSPPALKGFTIIINRRLRYTYDGIVDTLKSKAHRVRVETVSLKVQGHGTLQGMEMAMRGEGTVSGVNYYATNDNVLLAALSDSETRMDLSMAGGGESLPINQRSIVVVSRPAR